MIQSALWHHFRYGDGAFLRPFSALFRLLSIALFLMPHTALYLPHTALLGHPVGTTAIAALLGLNRPHRLEVYIKHK